MAIDLGLNLRPGEGVYVPMHRGRVALRALIALLAVLAIGTAGFSWIEGWPLSQALYFTLITITTVGYGDEGISTDGRHFALLLLIGGISVASWSFGTMVQSAVSRELDWKSKMIKYMRSLYGHTIVCGYGPLGRHVATQLLQAGRQVVVVETDPDKLRLAVQDELPVLEGSASDDQTLIDAGIERADHLVAVVDHQVDNIVVTLSARGLNPDLKIIARAEAKEDEAKLQRAGATEIVSPFHSGAKDIATRIANPGVAAFLDRTQSSAEQSVALAEIRIEPASSLVGQTLAEYGRVRGTRISFVALERTGEPSAIPPAGATALCAGDLLIVAGDPEQVSLMTDLSHGNAVAG